MSLSFGLSEKPESLGHHFIVGLSGTVLDEYDKRILGRLKPAGILISKRNFEQNTNYEQWTRNLKKLLDDVRNYVERDKLIVTIDHEGGRVHRTPAPLTHFPVPRKYAGQARAVAKAMAIELKSIGVNVSWAPLADINSNPANPIIGERAFATSAEETAGIAVSFATALMEEGVLGCAKHYPGHGETTTDSHLELPVLDLSEQQLRERELVPFKALVDINIPFIMTAHIMFPQIDVLAPATLSEKLLRNIVRTEWGYDGIIVSDDLDMKAVSEGFKREATIGQAVTAGCDMFIVARYPDSNNGRPLVLADCLYRCLRQRAVTEDRLQQSFRRIDSVIKNRLKQYSVTALNPDIFEAHGELARSLG